MLVSQRSLTKLIDMTGRLRHVKLIKFLFYITYAFSISAILICDFLQPFYHKLLDLELLSSDNILPISIHKEVDKKLILRLGINSLRELLGTYLVIRNLL